MQNKPPSGQAITCRRCGKTFTRHPSTPDNQVSRHLCPACIAQMMLEVIKREPND